MLALVDSLAMSSISLGELLPAYPGLHAMGVSQNADQTLITSIVYDSRRVESGSLFFAMQGVHSDGHDFLLPALEAGAAALIVERWDDAVQVALSTSPEFERRSIPVFQADNARHALSALSAAFYRYPADELMVIGVTGTDGKSSCVSFLQQMIESIGIPCGFISTVAFQTGEQVQDNSLRQSTPEAPEIHGLLRAMVEGGKQAAVVECTSHGLSDKTARLRDLSYDGVLFTNVSHEHLEFHGSFQQYLADKASLFSRLRDGSRPGASAAGKRESVHPGSTGAAAASRLPNFRGPVAVVNLNDPSWPQFADAALKGTSESGETKPARLQLWGYSADGRIPQTWNKYVTAREAGTMCSRNAKLEPTGSSYLLEITAPRNAGAETSAATEQTASTTPVQLAIPGSFNIDNSIGCAAVLSGLFALSGTQLAQALEGLKGVKGRMVPVIQGQNFAALVDYAHTPGAFQAVFPMFRQSCNGKLIAVFGSAGERDVEKRPIQGKIAADYADILVITDEDPRLEDSMTIINQIAEGARESSHACQLELVSDRRQAIERAFSLAESGDLVVMLGKGHEGSIITAHGKLPWDEEQVARDILSAMGYTKDNK